MVLVLLLPVNAAGAADERLPAGEYQITGVLEGDAIHLVYPCSRGPWPGPVDDLFEPEVCAPLVLCKQNPALVPVVIHGHLSIGTDGSVALEGTLGTGCAPAQPIDCSAESGTSDQAVGACGGQARGSFTVMSSEGHQVGPLLVTPCPPGDGICIDIAVNDNHWLTGNVLLATAAWGTVKAVPL